MDINKPVIVSFSSKGREDYNKGMLDLIKSTIDCGYDGDYLMYSLDGNVSNYLGIGIELGNGKMPSNDIFPCSPHNIVPYQFKIAMIQKAKDLGYTKIIWCDTSAKMNKDFTPLLDKAKRNGVVVFDNLGHPVWRWIADVACEKLGVSEDIIKSIPQIIAGIQVWDFSSPIANKIFNAWMERSLDGVSFQNNGSKREGFIAHRHDQAVLSIICWQNNIPFEPYGTVVCPPHQITKEYGDNYYFYYKL